MLKKGITIILFVLINLTQAQAVQLSNNGSGEVLIFPYYTVNNNLNTIYSIINTTAEPKAIKINFYEADNGRDVMSFNVYLSAHDVWTGALVPVVSEHEDHIGENSTLHLTTDQSCAPFLVKNGQEFLPNDIEEDSWTDLQRLRAGYFVVSEMGVLSGFAEEYADHGNSGVPENCAGLEAAWEVEPGEPWDLNTTVFPPSGGLIGGAHIVDVGDGVSFTYDAVALENFWGEDDVMHTHPQDHRPDFRDAHPESRILLDNGELAVSQWNHGYEAVSAVLMQSEVWGDYMLDSVVNGKSEWVITMPTKYFHTNLNGADTSPFRSQWNGETSCDGFEIEIYDREAQFIVPQGGTVTTPPTVGPTLCFASNMIRFLLPGADDSAAGILEGDTQVTFRSLSVLHATESGWALIQFDRPNLPLSPDSGVGFQGLPVIGFGVQKFYNAGAQEGLLAQYGSLFALKGKVEIED